MRRTLPPRLKSKIGLRRKKIGLTQEELGRAIGATQELVSMYERNLVYPEPERVVALCDNLKCKWGDLYEVLPP